MKKIFFKVIYYASVTVCYIYLYLSFFTYMGGIHVIFDMIEEGWHPNSFGHMGGVFLLRFRQLLAIVFWIAVVLCASLPFAKIKQDKKYKTASICLLVLVALATIPWIVKWFL